MVLKLTSKFKPFTFDEMVKPLQMYKEAYDKVEEQYADLSTQTEMWRDIANKTNSPEAYEMFRRYADQLQAVTDDFATGMTLQNRSQLMNMKRRYAAEIIPIQKAKEAYDKMVETREKISSADDSAIFVNHYNSIDDFLHGGTADNTYVSGNKLMARVAAKCEAYGRSEYGKMEIAKTVSRGYQDLYEQKNGYSYADLKEVLAQHPESKAAQDINAIIQSELHAAGYDNLNDFDKSKLANYAESGAYSGLSKPAFQFVDSGLAHAQNYEMENKRLAEQIREANMQDARARQQMALSDKHARWQREDNRASRNMQAAQHNKDTYISLVTSGVDSNTAYKLVYGTVDKNTKVSMPKNKGDRKSIMEAANNQASGAKPKRLKNGDLVVPQADGTTAILVAEKTATGKAIKYKTPDGKTAGTFTGDPYRYVSVTKHDPNKPLDITSIKKDVGHWGVQMDRNQGKVINSNYSPAAYYATQKTPQGQYEQYAIGNYDAYGNYTGGGMHPTKKYKDLYSSAAELKKKDPEGYAILKKHVEEQGGDMNRWRFYRNGDFYLAEDIAKYPGGYYVDEGIAKLPTGRPKGTAASRFNK